MWYTFRRSGESDTEDNIILYFDRGIFNLFHLILIFFTNIVHRIS